MVSKYVIGFQHVCPIEDFPDERWETMIHVMLSAPFYLTKYLTSGMKKRSKAIIYKYTFFMWIQNICFWHGSQECSCQKYELQMYTDVIEYVVGIIIQPHNSMLSVYKGLNVMVHIGQTVILRTTHNIGVSLCSDYFILAQCAVVVLSWKFM